MRFSGMRKHGCFVNELSGISLYVVGVVFDSKLMSPDSQPGGSSCAEWAGMDGHTWISGGTIAHIATTWICSNNIVLLLGPAP